VQQSTLDARSAGWGRVLRAKGVELFDLLPRVQASLVKLPLMASDELCSICSSDGSRQ
jgi:hypothetical protein